MSLWLSRPTTWDWPRTTTERQVNNCYANAKLLQISMSVVSMFTLSKNDDDFKVRLDFPTGFLRSELSLKSEELKEQLMRPS